MKNLLIYINPKNGFDREYRRVVPIQIDNTLKYFDKKDIILATNFPYEHNEIKAIVVPDDLYCDVHDKASKINVIIHLLEENIINELTWFHDIDAFQIGKLNLKLDKEIGFTDYGYSPKWNTGSIFFEPSSLEVFYWIRYAVYKYETDEERALMKLTDSNFKNINSRYERLNVTYNFGTRRFKEKFVVAHKPIKVLHFHPHRAHHVKGLQSVIPPYLIKMFHEYPIEKPYGSMKIIEKLYEKSTNVHGS